MARSDEPGNEEGSILPLLLGYVMLALSAIFVCVCATDLYIAQKRLDGLADSAALAGTYGFEISDDALTARAALSSPGVREQAEAVIAAIGTDATLVDAVTPDGVSAYVTVATVWHPPIFALFVPEGVQLQSTGTSRTALR